MSGPLPMSGEARLFQQIRQALGVATALRKCKADPFPPMLVAYEVAGALLARVDQESRDSVIAFRERFLAWTVERYSRESLFEDYDWSCLLEIAYAMKPSRWELADQDATAVRP